MEEKLKDLKTKLSAARRAEAEALANDDLPHESAKEEEDSRVSRLEHENQKLQKLLESETKRARQAASKAEKQIIELRSTLEGLQKELKEAQQVGIVLKTVQENRLHSLKIKDLRRNVKPVKLRPLEENKGNSSIDVEVTKRVGMSKADRSRQVSKRGGRSVSTMNKLPEGQLRLAGGRTPMGVHEKVKLDEPNEESDNASFYSAGKSPVYGADRQQRTMSAEKNGRDEKHLKDRRESTSANHTSNEVRNQKKKRSQAHSPDVYYSEGGPEGSSEEEKTADIRNK